MDATEIQKVKSFMEQCGDAIKKLEAIAESSQSQMEVNLSEVINMASNLASSLTLFDKAEKPPSLGMAFDKCIQRLFDLIVEVDAALSSPRVAYVEQTLPLLNQKLRNWWSRNGVGSYLEISYNGAGALVTLSAVFLDGPSEGDSERIARVDALQRAGIVMQKIQASESGYNILDVESTRRAVTQIIVSAIPSAKIQKFENYILDDIVILSGIVLHIPRLQDISKIP